HCHMTPCVERNNAARKLRLTSVRGVNGSENRKRRRVAQPDCIRIGGRAERKILVPFRQYPGQVTGGRGCSWIDPGINRNGGRHLQIGRIADRYILIRSV